MGIDKQLWDKKGDILLYNGVEVAKLTKDTVEEELYHLLFNLHEYPRSLLEDRVRQIMDITGLYYSRRLSTTQSQAIKEYQEKLREKTEKELWKLQEGHIWIEPDKDDLEYAKDLKIDLDKVCATCHAFRTKDDRYFYPTCDGKSEYHCMCSKRRHCGYIKIEDAVKTVLALLEENE